MGLRERTNRGGGGFWNGVVVLFTDYRFTTELPGGKEQEGDGFKRLFCQLFGRVDGSDKVESTHLWLGSADDFVISEDGKTLSPVGEDSNIWRGTPFTLLYNSFVDNGGPDNDNEPGGDITLQNLLGHRCELKQIIDEGQQENNRKYYQKNQAKAKKNGFNEKGERKQKDGDKFYPPKTPVVTRVVESGLDISAAAMKKAASKNKPVAAGSGTKPASSSKPVADNSDELADFTKNMVLEILGGAKDNKIAKTGLNVAVTRYFQQPDYRNDDRRDAARRLAYDDTFLTGMAGEGLITYAKSGKDQVLALVA